MSHGTKRTRPGEEEGVEASEQRVATATAPRGRTDLLLAATAAGGDEPVTTDSGLLLTHRRTPVAAAASAATVAKTSQGINFVLPSPSPVPVLVALDGGGRRAEPSSLLSRFRSAVDVTNHRDPSRASHVHHRLAGCHSADGGGGGVEAGQRMLRLPRAWTAALLTALALGGGTALAAARRGGAARAQQERRGPATSVAAAATMEPADGGAVERRLSQLGAVARPPPLAVDAVDEGEEEQFVEEAEGRMLLASARRHDEHVVHGGHGNHIAHGAHFAGGKHGHHHHDEGVLRRLRSEFEEWAEKHKRNYGSHEEKESRFHIWVDNHHRTMEKNEKHGPCKMTNKAVFGDNHFKDLTTEEFRSQYLTGYGGPRTDKLPERHRSKLRSEELARRHRAAAVSSPDPAMVSERQSRPTSAAAPDPITATERHPSVQRRYEEHVLSQTSSGLSLSDALGQKTYIDHWNSGKACSDAYGKTYVKRERNNKSSKESNCGGYKSEYDSNASQSGRFSWYTCRWYDVSCWLRVIFTGSAYGGSSEPAYDGDSYPSAIDWRDMGAVTDVHSQGSCGACWAITAVETIESASFIRSGDLLDLAESEVIVCDYTCALCEGGWPQNAYEYVMNNRGLPLEENWYYDDYWLLMLTYYSQGESDELNADDVSAYLTAQCPRGDWLSGNGGSGSGGGSGGGSGSGDNNMYYYQSDYLSATRYGQIKDYAYATDRCVCYTDGTGCDCEEQNEKRALMNVASYGPATICLDASVWQDYDGGVLTFDSGCSAAFLDMNHCVQVVGYAFTDGSEDEMEDVENQNSGSGSGGGSGSGSRDDADRLGYWIVRNQWGDNWGMGGYMYLAMGYNTCGILNDMTQAFGK